MVGNDRFDLLLQLRGHNTLGDLGEEVLLLGNEVGLEGGVPGDDVLDGEGVKETVDSSVDEGRAKRPERPLGRVR
jgi:hypothetical protein